MDILYTLNDVVRDVDQFSSGRFGIISFAKLIKKTMINPLLKLNGSQELVNNMLK